MSPDAVRRCAFAAAILLMIVRASPSMAKETKRPELLVFAASSLTDVLGEISTAYERQGGETLKLSFAASSVLARQIEAGGRADVFISADQEWMDYLQARTLIDKSSRRVIAGNRLVLIAPADSKVELRIAPGFPLLATLGRRRLATGDPDTVPAGRYARSALTSLGLWDQVEGRLVRADNVRSAMMYVARGETPLGIVFNTDALLDPRVRIVDTFPANTHAPITYPAAVVRGSRSEARHFLDYLTSPKVGDTWRKFGFLELKQ